jgi:hypothetical protein
VIRGQGQAVSRVAWFLVVPVSAPVTGGSLRAAGVPAAPLGGIAAGAVTGVALVAVWLAAFGECTAANQQPAPPSSSPWAAASVLRRRSLAGGAGRARGSDRDGDARDGLTSRPTAELAAARRS